MKNADLDKLDVGREFNPECPYCNDVCIPFSIEIEDGSGWLVGWTCACDEVKRLEGKNSLPYGMKWLRVRRVNEEEQ